jgi:hypothetical protein
VKAIRIMKTKVNNKPKTPDIFTPRPNAISRIINPWINATVAPPSVRPIIIEKRLTGATKTSCKNPNCLSHNTEIPVNMEENKIAIAMMPGARKDK